MNRFQILALGLLACLIVVTLLRGLRRRTAWRSSAAWLSLWGAAAIAIANPGLTSRVASLLGIGRGADLVFYCAILGMLVGLFAVYLRLRQIDAHLTSLVREIALQGGRLEALESEQRSGDPGVGSRSE